MSNALYLWTRVFALHLVDQLTHRTSIAQCKLRSAIPLVDCLLVSIDRLHIVFLDCHAFRGGQDFFVLLGYRARVDTSLDSSLAVFQRPGIGPYDVQYSYQDASG